MMNVNFFEKKKINLLPYLVVGIFLLLLLIMGIYFFLARGHYANVIEDNNNWLSENAEEVALSREISELDTLAAESVNVQEILRENQYPMDEVATDLAATVPDEMLRIASFQMSDPNQLSLILENTQPTMAQTIVESLEEKDYVEQVQFIYAQNPNPEDDDIRFEMLVDLDPEYRAEEAEE